MSCGRRSGSRVTRPARIALHRALDEARFGTGSTLDLRTSLPTAADAVRRAEAWLRERQMSKAGEVLIVTGRGNGSPGGIGIIREVVRKLLTTLKRKGVVSSAEMHTPGSFVVKLAPVRSLFQVTPRSRTRGLRVPPADPSELSGLAKETLTRLRRLAERALDALGAPRSERFVEDEMARQYAVLTHALGTGSGDREERFLRLIDAALDALDEPQ